MAMHPNPSFPLLVNDQADVIRIYLDLMIERQRAERSPEVMMSNPSKPGNDTCAGWGGAHQPDRE